MKRILALLVLLGLLVGCTTTTPEPTQAPTQEATEEPTAEPTEEATEEPTAEARVANPGNLLLATTTSTQDSGLLDYLLPNFEQEYGVTVEVVAVGTGQAIQLGVDGNADVLLVHARAQEDDFMAQGHGVRREDVMYNDFIIVGPAEDPAGIGGMNNAAEAMAAIAAAQAPFISRGDNSGTHIKEQAVWASAGIEPAGDWYVSSGQGMGDVLTMADEMQAYALSDRATYLARTLEGTTLEIVVEGDPILFNPYGVIAVNPDKGDFINADLANTFIDWLVSLPTQEMIGQFGVEEFGAPLFTPDSTAWRDAQAAMPALRVTGNVNTEIGWSMDELQAMGMVEAQYTNREGQVETASGVPIIALLELAGLPDGATTVTLVADDGYTAELPLADVQGCANCIVAFRTDGTLKTVLPDFPGNVQVKGVIEIQVQ